MKKEDWIAVESYDMRPHLLVDFTQDKNQVMGALGQLRIPGFSETNLFDALYDTIDRLEGVEGQKYILLICNGIDTFSKRLLSDGLGGLGVAADYRLIELFQIRHGVPFSYLDESRKPYNSQSNLPVLMGRGLRLETPPEREPSLARAPPKARHTKVQKKGSRLSTRALENPTLTCLMFPFRSFPQQHASRKCRPK